MKYVYHFHCRVNKRGGEGIIWVDGLHLSSKKIVDEETYFDFRKTTWDNLEFPDKEFHVKEDMQIITLSFLHEIEE